MFKVVVVLLCEYGVVEVDYFFFQFGVEQVIVIDYQNCGNLLVGIGFFVVECDLVVVGFEQMMVCIYMFNLDGMVMVLFVVGDGFLIYEGVIDIVGVLGIVVLIIFDFEDIVGGFCGNLLLIGNIVDMVVVVLVIMVDNGMLVVVMCVIDVGIDGYELCEDFEDN